MRNEYYDNIYTDYFKELIIEIMTELSLDHNVKLDNYHKKNMKNTVKRVGRDT